ncbi:ABC transporter ATP-binding protein [Aquipseudomonas alcaligenes]|uniref:ABC transporter ATP-binding protein n=1 Tax=Aquipseudomonas alcaligenes TaxID=43263 RepID=UPI00364AA24C
MNTDTAIKIQALSKVYKLYESPISRLKEALHPFKKKYHQDFHALNNVNLEIKKGESVGIIGNNGSGKSTLLKIITGVLTQTNGSVSVHGKISAILELGAGFNPEMTGVENIYLNNSLNGLSKKQTDMKIKEIIAFADLGDFIFQPIKTYSSGMKARLAFAVSINVDPDILIVDEALSVGDASFGRKCFAKMEEIRAKGATIIFVSHSEASIVSLCSKAVWLSRGESVLEGTPKLVTGLYMKHINEKRVDVAALQHEYKTLVAAESKRSINSDKASGCSNGLIGGLPSKQKTPIEEFFNPALKPSSTITYTEKGARIFDVKVSTTEGKVVNVLKQGGIYLYSYKVDIKSTLKNVQFGFLIKKKDGTPLGGGAFPGRQEFIPQLSGLNEINILFRCELGSGEYFLNCGVLADIDSKNAYAHRIIDAYVIKVIEAENYITESVNFIEHFSIVRVV